MTLAALIPLALAQVGVPDGIPFDWNAVVQLVIALLTFLTAIGTWLNNRGLAKAAEKRVEMESQLATVHEEVREVKTQTNGMNAAVVAATEIAARAQGKAEGKTEARGEQKADAAELVAAAAAKAAAQTVTLIVKEAPAIVGAVKKD